MVRTCFPALLLDTEVSRKKQRGKTTNKPATKHFALHSSEQYPSTAWLLHFWGKNISPYFGRALWSLIIYQS